MAKKRTGQRNRNLKTADPVDLSLPQNIVLFGEQTPEETSRDVDASSEPTEERESNE